MSNDKKMHANVHLNRSSEDCRSGDPTILGPDSQVYCIPAAYRERKDSAKYLICLLLKAIVRQNGTFSRIGLMKIAAYDKSVQNAIMTQSGDEESTPHKYGILKSDPRNELSNSKNYLRLGWGF